MLPSMTSKLVTLITNSLDHLRKSRGNPAQGKKSAFDACLIKHREDQIGVSLNPRWKRVPVIAIYEWIKSRHLKVVLDIDRQGVGDPVV